MRTSVSAAPESAMECTSASDSENAVESDSDDWFGSIARQMLGKDAGFALHLVTGAPEGSCYKYVTKQSANRRQPPGWIIVQLLRSDQGRQWFNAFMQGSTAEWWQELELAREIAEVLSKRK